MRTAKSLFPHQLGTAPEGELAALLSGSETPTATQQRAAATATAEKEVDAAPERAQLAQLALRAISDVTASSAIRAAEFQARREASYQRWLPEHAAAVAARLISLTKSERSLTAQWRARWPGQALAAPVTSADWAALDLRRALLDSGGPEQARTLVEDAQRRGDLSFLTAAGLLISAWQGRRNSWSGAVAVATAEELLGICDTMTWTPENHAHQFVTERASATDKSWNYLMALLTSGQKFDVQHRQTGALSPLLEPEPEPTSAAAGGAVMTLDELQASFK